MAQGRRQADVRPLTWEVPVAAAAAWLLVAAMLLPAGQGAAGLLFGGGWVWPSGGAGLVHAITGLATGHVGRALPPVQAGKLPGSGPVYLLIVVAELALAAGTVWAVTAWWRHLGPGALHGMADRAEAASVLGLANVRARRAEIRPDLYQARRRGDTGPAETQPEVAR